MIKRRRASRRSGRLKAPDRDWHAGKGENGGRLHDKKDDMIKNESNAGREGVELIQQ